MTTPATPSAPASPLIFFKHITPYWLRDHAKLGFSKGDAEVTETAFKIPSDTRKNESLFQIELLPRGALQDTDDIVVKVKVGVEYPGDQPRSNPPRRDPMIFSLWCPREDESIGIQINDYLQFQTIGPFRGVEANASERGLRNPQFLGERATKDWYRFPEQFEFTYRPNSSGGIPWASAYCAVDTGTFSAFGPYYNSLRLSSGLNLGIYRDELNEEYIIKSLEIAIYRNSLDVHQN